MRLFAICAALLHLASHEQAFGAPLLLKFAARQPTGRTSAGLGLSRQSVSTAALLSTACDDEMPLVVIAELAPAAAACAAIAQLRSAPATQHIPVLAFSRAHDVARQSQAREAGVTLLAADAGIAEQLPQLLDRILQVE